VVARNEDKVVFAPAFSRILRSGSRFCIGAFSRNPASVAVKVFSHLILFKKLYKFCSFNAICRGTAAIDFITVEHKKRFISINSDGHTT
jgi:hypothetical protein